MSFRSESLADNKVNQNPLQLFMITPPPLIIPTLLSKLSYILNKQAHFALIRTISPGKRSCYIFCQGFAKTTFQMKCRAIGVAGPLFLLCSSLTTTFCSFRLKKKFKWTTINPLRVPRLITIRNNCIFGELLKIAYFNFEALNPKMASFFSISSFYYLSRYIYIYILTICLQLAKMPFF